MSEPIDDAQIAYEAYRNHTGGISLASGGPIPEWGGLRPDIQAAWKASADALRKPVTGETSDGYHTFNELYEHRFALWIALCKRHPMSWRAKLHFDGTMYDGWFIVGLKFAPGSQITYHLPLSKWDDCLGLDTYEKAPCEFDGHTSTDVLERLKRL